MYRLMMIFGFQIYVDSIYELFNLDTIKFNGTNEKL
jgi:hypothetical protein